MTAVHDITDLPPDARDVYLLAHNNAIAAGEKDPDKKAWDTVELGWEYLQTNAGVPRRYEWQRKGGE